MSDILGYFGDKNGNPIAYMRQSGIILFSDKKDLVKYNYLGDFSFLNMVISSGNRDMFNVNVSKKNARQQSLPKKGGKSREQQALRKEGGGGFFGESQGSCGWGNNPSCCFTSCAPLWRTTLWPFSDATM
jgi:hypothetical protein